MDTNDLILRIADSIEKQVGFSNWNSTIQLLATLPAWITIGYLLYERSKKERPYLQVSFELLRSSLACIVIRNIGECPLEIKTMEFNSEFICQLEPDTQEKLKTMCNLELKIFPKQFHVVSLDTLTGTILEKFQVKKLIIHYTYKRVGYKNTAYKEDSIIDFTQYNSMLLYISEIDELKNSVDKVLKEVKEINKSIKPRF